MPTKKRTPGAVDNSARAKANAEAINDAPKNVKRIPGERIKEDPNVPKMDPVMALIVGEEPAPNETVQYFIDKIKALGEEGVALEAEFARLSGEAATAQQRIGAIRYEIESTKADIAIWRLRPDAKPADIPTPE